MPDPEDKSTILDTPDQIELFRLLQMKYALKTEIDTGLRHSRGSILKLVNRTLIFNSFITKPKRTKKEALQALDAYIGEKTQHLIDDPA